MDQSSHPRAALSSRIPGQIGRDLKDLGIHLCAAPSSSEERGVLIGARPRIPPPHHDVKAQRRHCYKAFSVILRLDHPEGNASIPPWGRGPSNGPLRSRETISSYGCYVRFGPSVPYGPIARNGSIDLYHPFIPNGRLRHNVRFGLHLGHVPSVPVYTDT